MNCNDLTDNTPYEQEPDWLASVPVEPESKQELPAAALDGWLGKVCRERLSEFPRSVAWLALVTAASVHVSGGRSNLFTILIGRAGDGKTEACNRARWLMSVDDKP